MNSKDGIYAKWSIAALAATFALVLNAALAGPDAVISYAPAKWAAERFHPHFLANWLGVEPRTAEMTVVLAVAAILAALAWYAHRCAVTRAVAKSRPWRTTRPATSYPGAHPIGVRKPPEPAQPQQVAVMFADIVGFTRLAERENPARLLELLRAFHDQVGQAILDHQGTVDKILGDGVMATFRTQPNGAGDAANAIRCARAMIESIAEWNRERLRSGQPAIKLSIGIHYGEVYLADIGPEQHLELAVLGDTVNVASRLEGLTRDLDCQVVVSEALIQAVNRESCDYTLLALDGFQRGAAQTLRGRLEPVTVWAFAA